MADDNISSRNVTVCLKSITPHRAAQTLHWRGLSLHGQCPTHVDSQLIALLKNYWLLIVGVIAALAFWVHHKITALLDDDAE